jgi:hypothetical protein
LRALATTLERSIPRSEDGRRVQEYSRVPWFAGLFYPAYDKYLWPRDCNWWTVARLAEAGLARGATGVIFSGQVNGRLLGFERVEVAGPR